MSEDEKKNRSGNGSGDGSGDGSGKKRKRDGNEVGKGDKGKMFGLKWEAKEI